MKIITKLSPKHLFRSKKDRSIVTRSDPSSFSSGTTSSSSSEESVTKRKLGSGGGAADIGTPTSVLPEISGEWSDNSNFDGNNDGIVSRSQLESLLTRLGAEPPSREEINMVLSEIDHDGDGCITLDDLLNRFVGSDSCNKPGFDSELHETFDFFDSDHDGKITAEELLGAFSSFGDEQCTLDDCRRMIAGVDKNGDGFVCFEDFLRMMELQR